jgi:hypothetical protein
MMPQGWCTNQQMVAPDDPPVPRRCRRPRQQNPWSVIWLSVGVCAVRQPDSSSVHQPGPAGRVRESQLVRDFPDDLGLDGLDELRLLLHRNQKGSRITDNAVAVVEIEILDILEAVGRLQHDQQAVYGDATGQSLVAGQGYGSTRVVGSITRDVDDLPIRLQAALTELPDAEVDAP